MKIMYFFIYLYLLLKPFYIFKSGGIQPSDLFLVLALLLLLISKKRNEIRRVLSSNLKYIIFIICVVLINSIYYIIYNNSRFVLSTLYYIFIFIGILLFSFVFNEKGRKKIVSKILKIDIIMQLIIYFLGFGRIYVGTRYMGTFNDPNQFGYFIFICYMFIYLISLDTKETKGNIFFLLISIFLIFKCASTGMLLGITVFLILQIIDILRKIFYFINKNKVKIFVTIIFFVPIFLIILLINNNNNFINIKNSFMMSRVMEKFSRVDNTNESNMSLYEERGYDKFVYYPQYILYGSGEGEYNRFVKARHQGEIHATFPSILFYYGIFPFIILLSWIYDKIRKANIKVLIPLFALFIESFTLLNQRQVLFWVLILFISYLPSKNCEN